MKKYTHAQVVLILRDYDSCRDIIRIAQKHGIEKTKLEQWLAARDSRAGAEATGKSETIGDYYSKNMHHMDVYNRGYH